MFVNTHIRPSNCQLGNVGLQRCHQLRRVACWAEVALALELAVCIGRMEVHLSHSVSSICADSERSYFAPEGVRLCGLGKAWRVFF